MSYSPAAGARNFLVKNLGGLLHCLCSRWKALPPSPTELAEDPTVSFAISPTVCAVAPLKSDGPLRYDIAPRFFADSQIILQCEHNLPQKNLFFNRKYFYLTKSNPFPPICL